MQQALNDDSPRNARRVLIANSLHRVHPLSEQSNADKAADVHYLHQVYDHALNATIREAFESWINDESFPKRTLGVHGGFDAFHALPWDNQRRVFSRMEQMLYLRKPLKDAGYQWEVDKTGTRYISPFAFWREEFMVHVVNKSNVDRTVQEVLVELLQKLHHKLQQQQQLCRARGEPACECVDMLVVALLKMAMPMSMRFNCKTACGTHWDDAAQLQETTQACKELVDRLQFTPETWAIFKLFDRHAQFAFGCSMLHTYTAKLVPCDVKLLRQARQ